MACVGERPQGARRRGVGGVIAPLLSDGSASYTPSISERRGAATTFLHSGIKNADAQTSTTGTVNGTRVYDAFGAELSSTGSWQGAFGYAGGFGYREDANGFKLLGHRYCDPSTGRFLTRDPIKDGRIWYAYCENSPMVNVDPFGLWMNSARLGAKAGNTRRSGLTVGGNRWVESSLTFDGSVITLPPGTIYVPGPKVEQFLANRKWQAHEDIHVDQINRLNLQNGLPAWLGLFALQYALSGHHDKAPLEREADRLSGDVNEFPGGDWDYAFDNVGGQQVRELREDVEVVRKGFESVMPTSPMDIVIR
jgi:RHS repeat-associated protein